MQAKITVAEDGLPMVVTEKEHPLQDTETIDAFHRLTKSTGGVMRIVSRSSSDLPPIVDKLFQHILHSSYSYKSLDIAFVLDTTSSMWDDIDEIKKNLVNQLEKLKSEKANI